MSDDIAGSDLCSHCGMCCNGDLFTHGDLLEPEVEPVRQLGLRVDETAGRKPRFLMPCVAFAGSACTIYDHRPQTCRNYRCQTLKRFDEGAMSFAEAVAIVREGRRLAVEARQGADPGQPLPARRTSLDDPQVPPLERLRLLAYAHYVDQHFVSKKNNWLTAQPLVAQSGEMN